MIEFRSTRDVLVFAAGVLLQPPLPRHLAWELRDAYLRAVRDPLGPAELAFLEALQTIELRPLGTDQDYEALRSSLAELLAEEPTKPQQVLLSSAEWAQLRQLLDRAIPHVQAELTRVAVTRRDKRIAGLHAQRFEFARDQVAELIGLFERHRQEHEHADRLEVGEAEPGEPCTCAIKPS